MKTTDILWAWAATLTFGSVLAPFFELIQRTYLGLAGLGAGSLDEFGTLILIHGMYAGLLSLPTLIILLSCNTLIKRLNRHHHRYMTGLAITTAGIIAGHMPFGMHMSYSFAAYAIVACIYFYYLIQRPYRKPEILNF